MFLFEKQNKHKDTEKSIKDFNMTGNERENLIRAYAKGEISWHSLQNRGFDNYFKVLVGLGELGLRPPIAEMIGPNVESRQRGIAIIQEHLRKTSHV